jgi:hypothetical protein
MSEHFEFRLNAIDDVRRFVVGFFDDKYTRYAQQLGRAIENQVSLANQVDRMDPEISERCSVMVSRYANWAKEAEFKLGNAMGSLDEQGERAEALQKIDQVYRSLNAFAAIQENFIGHETNLNTSEKIKRFIVGFFDGKDTRYAQQLDRAFVNQVDLANLMLRLEPEISDRCSVMMSRYTDWATDAAFNLGKAVGMIVDAKERTEAIEEIDQLGRALKVFVAAQEQFIGRKIN